jgi:hypothetical protein
LPDKRYVFPSLSRASVMYTLHSDSMALWDSAYRSTRPIGPMCGEFPTYGDGTCQHGYEHAATAQDPGIFADYCASLASFLIETPTTEEIGDAIQVALGRIVDCDSREAITFALSVKYKDGPYRYFNARDRKVSARPGLAHDNRWAQIHEHHKGTVRSAHAVLHKDETVISTLELFARFEAIARVARDDDSTYVPYDGTVREVWGDHAGDIPQNFREVAGRVYGAFGALRTIVKSILDRRNAARSLECYISNSKRHAEAIAAIG